MNRIEVSKNRLYIILTWILYKIKRKLFLHYGYFKEKSTICRVRKNQHPWLLSNTLSIKNLLMFENKKVVNPFFISRNHNNISFPTPDIMAVYQYTFKGEAEDGRTTYFSLLNFKTKQMKIFKFKLIIKHFFMANEDQLFYINT